MRYLLTNSYNLGETFSLSGWTLPVKPVDFDQFNLDDRRLKMFTLYKGKRIKVIGEFLLPKAIMLGIAYGQTDIGVALGIIGFTISWSGEGEDD